MSGHKRPLYGEPPPLRRMQKRSFCTSYKSAFRKRILYLFTAFMWSAKAPLLPGHGADVTPQAVATGDFDGDGDTDVVVTTDVGTQVLKNDGFGGLANRGGRRFNAKGKAITTGHSDTVGIRDKC